MRVMGFCAVLMLLCACSYTPSGKAKFDVGNDDGVKQDDADTSDDVVIGHGCDESSGNHINLDTHDGIICLGGGSLFSIKVTAGTDVFTSVLESDPPKTKKVVQLKQVHLDVTDGKGAVIAGALRMWRQTEFLAKVVDDVVFFENLFISKSLPADAQLRVIGSKRGSDQNNDSYYFDIATLLGSDVNFSVDSSSVLESLLLKYKWHLGYWPKLKLNSVVDWYIEVGESSNASPPFSEVMQTVVTADNYFQIGGATNPSLILYASQPHENDKTGDKVLRDLPDCYRLVTKITSEVKGNNAKKIDKKVVIVVGKGIGTDCSF